MWGCFSPNATGKLRASVFPTHVGVFLNGLFRSVVPKSLPHACGGVSDNYFRTGPVFPSSPRMWGCFSDFFATNRISSVFPTHVGVFLPCFQQEADDECLPHACGGVSTLRWILLPTRKSSPRMWGCFLFGLRLNYFLIGLPHACGGVSSFRGSPNCLMLSSPRMWGCFCKCFFQVFIHTVFPTHVGVFLAKSLSPIRIQRLPHACGGVSDFRGNRRTVRASSPRMWGCFLWAV